MPNKKSIVKSGYTLAETLVTLAVIGVVAAISIPSLMNKTNDEELETAFKKNYAELSLAVNKLVYDKGGSIKYLNGTTTNVDDDNLLKEALKAYLNYTKECDHAATIGNCWHNSTTYKCYDGTMACSTGDQAGFVLANGAYLIVRYQNSDCMLSGEGENRCGRFEIDVNGAKGPNVLGKDIFKIHVQENKIKPYGFSVSTPCEQGSGGNCAAQRLRE